MRLLRQILAAAGIGLAPGLAQACALELILAVDVSGSIDAQEFALQNEGLAAAFEDPKLMEAIVHQKGGIYVVLTQWSGATRQRQVTDWHHLTGPESMAAFASEIRRGGRNWRNYSTAIGEALFHALQVGQVGAGGLQAPGGRCLGRRRQQRGPAAPGHRRLARRPRLHRERARDPWRHAGPRPVLRDQRTGRPPRLPRGRRRLSTTTPAPSCASS